MVLRPKAVRARLLKLEEVVSRLEEMGELDGRELARNFRDAWAAERGLQLGAATILDIGNHILSAHFGVSAQDYESIVGLLAQNGVLEEALAARLQGLGGFRSILVHDYLRIDPGKVAEFLARAPGDFTDLGRAVRAWLEKIAPGD